jgi:hypothetical protein
LSGGDRKALQKELVKSRAMTRIFAERSGEKRRVGEALIREANKAVCHLSCRTRAILPLPFLRMRRFSHAPVGATNAKVSIPLGAMY